MNDINKNLLHDPDTDASATINSSGELEVAVESLNPGTGATSLGKAEDAVHASGDTGVLTITVRRDSATQGAGTDGDYSVLITDANGRLHTLDANSAAIKTAVELIDDAISGNEMQVDIIASLPAGTNAIGQVDTVGNVAHDSADSGNPIKVGMKAVAHSSNPTAVAAGDRTDLLANRHGMPFFIGGHPNTIPFRVNYAAAQTNTAILTVSAGTKIVVTMISATLDNACSVDVQVRVGFGSSTTPTGTGVVLSHPGIAKGSGVAKGNGGGIIGTGADGEDLRVTCEVPTSGSIDIEVSYYTIES